MINDPIASRQRLFLEKTHTRSAPERASPSGPHSSRTARAQTVRPCSFWRSDALSDQKVRPTIFAPESSYGQSLVLLNTSSQDEDNYKNPYEAPLPLPVHSTA